MIKDIIKQYSALIGIYFTALILGYAVMKTEVPEFRWDLLFTFWAGTIWGVIGFKKN